MSNDAISLDQWLEALREQMVRARQAAVTARAADPLAPTFLMKDIELEVTMGSTISAGGEGKVRLWVVDTTAKGGVERSTTHKVRMRLELNTSGDYYLGSDGGKPAKPTAVVRGPGGKRP
jgi:hypothetical protein